MIRFDQNQVSKAIWPWTTSQSMTVIKSNSWVSAIPGFFIGNAIAGLFFYFDYVTMALLVVCISMLIFLTAFFFPKYHRTLRFYLNKASFFVGLFLTWVLFVPLYFSFFSLGRIVLTMRGKDPMCREMPSSVSSYWIERKSTRNLEQYKRQF